MFRGELAHSMALEWKGPRSEVVTQICFLHKMCSRQSSRAEQEGSVAARTPWSKELTTDVLYLGLTLLLYKISWKCHRVVPSCPCTVKLLPSLVFLYQLMDTVIPPSHSFKYQHSACIQPCFSSLMRFIRRKTTNWQFILGECQPSSTWVSGPAWKWLGSMYRYPQSGCSSSWKAWRSWKFEGAKQIAVKKRLIKSSQTYRK